MISQISIKAFWLNPIPNPTRTSSLGFPPGPVSPLPSPVPDGGGAGHCLVQDQSWACRSQVASIWVKPCSTHLWCPMPLVPLIFLLFLQSRLGWVFLNVTPSLQFLSLGVILSGISEHEHYRAFCIPVAVWTRFSPPCTALWAPGMRLLHFSCAMTR